MADFGGNRSTSHFTKLKRLELNNNSLSSVNLHGLKGLEAVSLAANRLGSVPDLTDQEELVYLDLSGNRITCTYIRGIATAVARSTVPQLQSASPKGSDPVSLFSLCPSNLTVSLLSLWSNGPDASKFLGCRCFLGLDRIFAPQLVSQSWAS